MLVEGEIGMLDGLSGEIPFSSAFGADFVTIGGEVQRLAKGHR